MPVAAKPRISAASPRSPQPAPPTRQFSFTDFQVNNPTSPPPGDRLDGEVDRTNQAVSDTIDWAAVSLNSDGSLRPQTVGKSQLVPGLFDNIGADVLKQMEPRAEDAKLAAALARTAASEADASALAAGVQNAQAQDAAGKSSTDAQDAASSAAEAAASANAAAASATNAANSDNHAAGEAAVAQDYAVVTEAWAEHMPDPIPPNILAVMGITGDHWSSRWWANYAQQFVENGLGVPGPVGPQGPAGPTGPQGPAGIGSISGLIVGQIPIAASATGLASSANLSGDVTSAPTTLVTTLATVNANVGTFQGLTVDAKGRVTAASNQGYLSSAGAAATYAPLANPVFTGDPRAPTPAPADNDTSIATTAYVQAQGYATSAAMSTADNLRVLRAGDTMTGALTVNADATVGALLTTGATVSTGTAGLELGGARTGDGDALVDFHATSGSDFELRLIRAAGVNGVAALQQTGTGRLNVTVPGGIEMLGGTVGIAKSLPLTDDLVLEVAGPIGSTIGYKSRSGSAGPYQGNKWNLQWSGTAAHFWVDTVDVGAITLTCDYRIKENVTDLPSVWEQVKSLRPISYTLKENAELLREADPATRWGFIAHELQETLLPTAASGEKDAPNIVQSPDLMAVCAALARALQEAMVRIEILEAG